MLIILIFKKAHLIESKCICWAFQHSSDFLEGVKSFQEKRIPKFVSCNTSTLPKFYPWVSFSFFYFPF